MFDRQEFFNKGVLGILKQGKRAATVAGSCLYRAEDGSKCFVGHNIPDDKYDPMFEGVRPDIRQRGFLVTERAIKIGEVLGLETVEDVDFVKYCQKALHDEIYIVTDDYYIDKCKEVAFLFGLEMPDTEV